jgi:hypothetical protein
MLRLHSSPDERKTTTTTERKERERESVLGKKCFSKSTQTRDEPSVSANLTKSASLLLFAPPLPDAKGEPPDDDGGGAIFFLARPAKERETSLLRFLFVWFFVRFFFCLGFHLNETKKKRPEKRSQHKAALLRGRA